MPYPAQISAADVLDAAEELIEAQGVEQLALNDVARALGVKTPSLYRYVDSKAGLLRQLNLRFLEGLFAAMHGAPDAAQPVEARLLAAMTAYRAYALAHPRLYLMAFAYMVDDLRPGEDLLVQMVLPLQAEAAELAGAADSLAALRSIYAYVHGFVMLELTNQLRRGGDLSADFAQGARACLAGWRRAPT